MRGSEIKLQFIQYIQFHLKNTLCLKFSLCYINKISDIRWINFFILARNIKTSHPKQMKLTLPYHLPAQILINNKLSDIKHFWFELKLPMDINYPRQYISPTSLQNLCLNLLHILIIYHKFHFIIFHI
jgi:hypothetical protein